MPSYCLFQTTLGHILKARFSSSYFLIARLVNHVLHDDPNVLQTLVWRTESDGVEQALVVAMVALFVMMICGELLSMVTSAWFVDVTRSFFCGASSASVDLSSCSWWDTSLSTFVRWGGHNSLGGECQTAHFVARGPAVGHPCQRGHSGCWTCHRSPSCVHGALVVGHRPLQGRRASHSPSGGS